MATSPLRIVSSDVPEETPNHFRFTRLRLEALPYTPSGQKFYWDTDVDGLGLRVTKSAKTYVVERKVLGKTCRLSLGRFPLLNLDACRDQAREQLLAMSKGIDPSRQADVHRLEQLNLRAAFDDYLNIHELKPLTKADYQSSFIWAFADWDGIRLAEITRSMVIARHKKLGLASKARANLAMRLLRAIFNFAIVKYDDDADSPLKGNPVAVLSKLKLWYRIARRKTYIAPDQLGSWLRAVLSLAQSGNHAEVTARDYLLMLLFHGLRKSEAASIRWENVDLKNMTFIAKETKNGSELQLPLASPLHPILEARFAARENAYVFNASEPSGHLGDIRKQMAKVTKASGVQFTLHDLRRTFITIAESLDIPGFALKRLVNHRISGDVTDGYIAPNPERLRGPIERVTQFILEQLKTL